MFFIYRKLFYLKEEIGKLINKESKEENKDKNIDKIIPVNNLENNPINKVDVKSNDDNKKEEVKKITYKKSKPKKRKSVAVRKNDKNIDNKKLKRSRTILPSNAEKIKNSILENKDYKIHQVAKCQF